MIRRYNGKDLVRLLIYYGLIGDVTRSDFNICCPFHDDPKPSMRITLDNGRFYCFGCGLSGDAYDFVRLAHPELNELETVIALEKMTHSKEVSTMQIRYKKKRLKNKQYLLDVAKDYYFGLIQNDWYNPKNEEEKQVLQYMKDRGFDERSLTICKCKANCYNVPYPIIFPIYDNGVFSGWVSRTTRKEVESQRKYLYNEGFKKRYTLCGHYEENSVPFLCEGFLDYLSLKAKGRVKNVAAILGWHISDEQIKKLKQKNIKKVVGALDNPKIDKSGKKGLELLQKHFEVIPFPYPEGVKDTGEMNAKQIQEAIKKIYYETNCTS